MAWYKFSEKQPGPEEIGRPLIIYDGDHLMLTYGSSGKLFSTRYCCNDPKCHRKPSDCGCPFIITPDCYWMRIAEPTKEKHDKG